MKKVCSLLTAWLLLGVLFMGCTAPAPSGETVPTASAVPGTASPTPAATPLEPEDYAASVQPAGSGTAVSQTVTVHTFIDGDTVHFNVPESVNETGVLKARFLAVNTPESTGRVEENRIPGSGTSIPPAAGIWCGSGISLRAPLSIET